MREKFKKVTLTIVANAFIVSILCLVAFSLVRAETSGSSPESGATSRIKTLYTTLQTATYGSDTDTPDWGTYWNRIKTAASWVPNGNSAVTDVKSGKTFFNSTRTAQTGTYPNPTNCSTQAYEDKNASATASNNCSLTWTTSLSPVTGDDSLAGRGGLDPRTGLVWSQLLLNNAGTVVFSPTTNSTWSWNNSSDADNVAVGSKTAIQLCSERGNGWRLPTQKELMQAYIDGSYWNVTQSDLRFWSATEYYATDAMYMELASSKISYSAKTLSSQVRCVR